MKVSSGSAIGAVVVGAVVVHVSEGEAGEMDSTQPGANMDRPWER
jgi:hypothetical protein